MYVSRLTNGVGGGLLALLVHAVVPGDGAVSGLTLHCPPVRTHQHAGHHAKATVACITEIYMTLYVCGR